MNKKLTAIAVASAVGGLGLTVLAVPPAEAGTPAATATPSPVRIETKVDKSLSISTPESQRIAALQNTTNTSLGAVTFVNDFVSQTDPVTVVVSQNGTEIGEIVALDPGVYTVPQLLPSGTYQVVVDDSVTKAQETTGTVTVIAGTASSVVVSGVNDPSDPALEVTLDQFVDNVSTVPAGQNILSLRNTLPFAIDFSLNGTVVATDVSSGQSADVTVPAGSYAVAVSIAGDAAEPPTTIGTLLITQDHYVPVYEVLDPSTSSGVALAATPYAEGYEYTAADGGVFNYGAYPFLGSTGGAVLNDPVVGGAEAADGSGYWLAASDGGVFAFGAPYAGSLGGLKLNAPIVGIAATEGTNGKPGYLLAAKDGGVFAFNAPFYGSLGGTALTSPVIGVAADPETGGYLLAQANGTVTEFAAGLTTPVVSSVGPLTHPLVAVAETPDGGGAWLVSSDGGVFTIGDAGYYGSASAVHLNAPIVGIEPTNDGLGYNLIAKDGGVFSYGDAQFYGSTASTHLNQPVVGAIVNG